MALYSLSVWKSQLINGFFVACLSCTIFDGSGKIFQLILRWKDKNTPSLPPLTVLSTHPICFSPARRMLVSSPSSTSIQTHKSKFLSLLPYLLSLGLWFFVFCFAIWSSSHMASLSPTPRHMNYMWWCQKKTLALSATRSLLFLFVHMILFDCED